MTSNGGPMFGQPEGQAPLKPQFGVLAQYTKDLSFENPNAPQSLQQQPGQQPPAINLQINVTPRQLTNTDFEVELSIEGKAENGTNVLFSFELIYAGVFRMLNIPQESLGPFVMIECPRLLFPFAREIVANAVISGGFPPLMLDPVDFVTLYQQKMSQMETQMASAVKPA